MNLVVREKFIVQRFYRSFMSKSKLHKDTFSVSQELRVPEERPKTAW